MEFAVIDSYLVTIPAETEHTMPNLPNCEEPFQYTSMYHSMGTRFKTDDGVWSKGNADGMNSAGLSFSGLYFPAFSHFPQPEEVGQEHCNNAVSHVRVGDYILSTFATVLEVREAIENGTFPLIYIEADLGYVHPIHYQVIDQTGEGMVLEYTKEGMKTFKNTIGVFTNSPTYDWHMENLRNYPQLRSVNRKGYGYHFKDEEFFIPVAGSGSGLAGIPGDYTSVSRFIKAANMVQNVEKPMTKNQALVQTFHLMNAADIPVGIVQIPKGGEGGEENQSKSKKCKKGKKGKKCREENNDEEEEEKPQEFLSDATSYITVKSLSDGCLFLRAYDDLSINRLCFDNMPTDMTRWLPIEGKWKNSYKDINPSEMEEFNYDDVDQN